MYTVVASTHHLRACLHGGGTAFLVGLPSPRGMDFTRVYMGKASPPTRAGSLSRVIRATSIFQRKPESDICVQVFIL